MSNWKVELVPEAQEDFNRLDGSVKKLVLKQLIKLEQNPMCGVPFGNKAGINLEGYFKLYADKKRIRIIYEQAANFKNICFMYLFNGFGLFEFIKFETRWACRYYRIYGVRCEAA